MKFALTSGEYPVSRIEVGQTANVLDIIDVKVEVAGRVIVVFYLVFIAYPASELLAVVANSVMSIVESTECFVLFGDHF
jgi:hypothetical protein